jgi:Cu/Ag efflux pump CusA
MSAYLTGEVTMSEQTARQPTEKLTLRIPVALHEQARREARAVERITRAQPIVLTGLAAMLGAFFILDDPIFNGLAISLIFGILVSTLLTLVVIPVLYYMAYRNRLGPIPRGE